MTKTITYKGVRLPEDVVKEIKEATVIWKDRDKRAWDFAEKASRIVGRYIPEATQLLANEMGLRSPSSPEGYAKAHNLRMDLVDLKHNVPLPNLYIGHYITTGKSYASKMKTVAGNEGEEYIMLLWADSILKEASKYDWSVEKMREEIRKGSPDEDAYINSAQMTIKNLEAHIINTSYLGVIESRAMIAAKIAKKLVRALKWVLGKEQATVESIEEDMSDWMEIYQWMKKRKEEAMNEAEILNWMVEHKYARNEFAARHIFEGLELNTVPTFCARVHRVILYRQWRESQMFDKRDTASCFAKAIAGQRVDKREILRAEAEAIF